MQIDYKYKLKKTHNCAHAFILNKNRPNQLS